MTNNRNRRMEFFICLALLLSLLLIFSCVGKNKTADGPEMVKFAKEKQGPGDVWIEPVEMTVKMGDSFKNEIHVNSGKQLVAAYGIIVIYNPEILIIDKDLGNSGATEGPYGFVQAVNPNEKGKIIISGFDVSGKGGPGEDLYMINLHWKALKAGTSELYTQIKNLVDDKYTTVGKPTGFAAKVIVN